MSDLIFKNIDIELEQTINDCLQGKEIVVTKFGNAKISYYGYYRITSGKEGNNGKRLHRLVWEDFYGKPIPEGYDIHHLNNNKVDNRIQNLQCVEHNLHMSFHKKGRTLSEETRKKMSEAQNTSGYYRVYKTKKKVRKQGFVWRYGYYENGKPRYIESVDINKLKEKVLAKGLEWYKIGKK